ncbi:MAG: Ubiquinone/menaquinone biosynthesis C-methylase UbiE [Chloroflexi bacterium]|jgi:ubiquinone/menaquinone biosynthesis C-methylase UbiE|nr:MAG: Ubiquinone/menaquinone biosynthesis C-methylase UbiE [Chloroflexota bacterium]
MTGMDFSFRQFTQHPFYTDLNSRLVDLSQIRPGQIVLDLACGTGAVTRLLLEKLKGAQESLVIGIDASATALRQAREDLQSSYANMAQFVQGRVENLSLAVRRSVDAVFLCNAIHMVPDKDTLLGEVRGVLRQDGTFSFNSAFYQGSMMPGTEQFYRRWMMRAIRIVRDRDGLTTSREKVESRKMLSPDQYKELLESNGFSVLRQRVDTAHMPLEAWLDISSFSDFINGALPGIPLAEASAALKDALIQVFDELKLKTVPRGWLEVVATRTA